ncbi:TetR/AcrR family transcriptional regulator [Antrihabitans sp. YC2-6]|nr:TetR/AcrR family transcriptional regulator [Antrihabitans sp. YC2-6]
MLHTLGDEPGERSDAARNRRLLLDAAESLVAESGPDCVTMDAVAAKAGVGKGTVFRRFGSRSGLMRALLDHTERQLQNDFMFGPPPLGPGADPVERIVAFGLARLAQVEVEGEVRRAADASQELRYSHPAHMLSHAHVAMLLRQAHIAGNIDLLADYLLGALDAGLVMHQTKERGVSLGQVSNSWEDLVRRVTR